MSTDIERGGGLTCSRHNILCVSTAIRSITRLKMVVVPSRHFCRFQRFYAQIQGFELLPYSQLPPMITSCFSEEKVLTALANLRLCDQEQQPEELSSPSLFSP